MKNEQGNNIIKDSYFLFEKVLKNPGSPKNPGTLKINLKIHKMVSDLKKYGLSENDILHVLFTAYLDKELYSRYKPEKAKLSTFVLHYAKYMLQALKKKYDRLFKNYKEVPFLDQDDDQKLSGRIGVSLSKLEKSGHVGVITKVSPEDIYIGKELKGLFEKHFTESELDILLGIRDRQEVAAENATVYDTVKKRLQRKVQTFLPVLAEAGYC